MVTKIQIAGKLKFYSKPYGRQWKWRYQTHGHINEPVLNIPKKLESVITFKKKSYYSEIKFVDIRSK